MVIFFIHFYLNTKQVYLFLTILDQLFLQHLIKALQTKILIDKNSRKLNIMKSTAAGLCTG
jgi:hypothetical protein